MIGAGLGSGAVRMVAWVWLEVTGSLWAVVYTYYYYNTLSGYGRENTLDFLADHGARKSQASDQALLERLRTKTLSLFRCPSSNLAGICNHSVQLESKLVRMSSSPQLPRDSVLRHNRVGMLRSFSRCHI